MGIADQRHAEQHPDHAAVAMQVALLELVALDAAGQDLPDIGRVGIDVVGVRDLLEAHVAQAGGVVADQLAQGPVDLEPAAVGGDDRHADGGEVERLAEPGLALAQCGLLAALGRDIGGPDKQADDLAVAATIGREVDLDGARLKPDLNGALVVDAHPGQGIPKVVRHLAERDLADDLAQGAAERGLGVAAEPVDIGAVAEAHAQVCVEVADARRAVVGDDAQALDAGLRGVARELDLVGDGCLHLVDPGRCRRQRHAAGAVEPLRREPQGRGQRRDLEQGEQRPAGGRRVPAAEVSGQACQRAHRCRDEQDAAQGGEDPEIARIAIVHAHACRLPPNACPIAVATSPNASASSA